MNPTALIEMKLWNAAHTWLSLLLPPEAMWRTSTTQAFVAADGSMFKSTERWWWCSSIVESMIDRKSKNDENYVLQTKTADHLGQVVERK